MQRTVLAKQHRKTMQVNQRTLHATVFSFSVSLCSFGCAACQKKLSHLYVKPLCSVSCLSSPAVVNLKSFLDAVFQQQGHLSIEELTLSDQRYINEYIFYSKLLNIHFDASNTFVEYGLVETPQQAPKWL